MTFGSQVIVHRRVVTGQDSYGNDVVADVDETVWCNAFAPGASVEVVQGRDTITTQPTVYLPPGVVIDGLSAVTANGIRFQVDGSPRVWVSPFTGWAPGVEVRLREVTG